jgi:hypothetical protein
MNIIKKLLILIFFLLLTINPSTIFAQGDGWAIGFSPEAQDMKNDTFYTIPKKSKQSKIKKTVVTFWQNIVRTVSDKEKVSPHLRKKDNNEDANDKKKKKKRNFFQNDT